MVPGRHGRGRGDPHDGCCEPPAAPGGLTAAPGGGSGEVLLTWDPAPGGGIASYRVHRQRGEGFWWLLAVVSADVRDGSGRVFVVDAPDYWPWPTGADASAERCYAVSVLSDDGLEGPMSPPVCGAPL